VDYDPPTRLHGVITQKTIIQRIKSKAGCEWTEFIPPLYLMGDFLTVCFNTIDISE
jgi:hypothetical protein